jgi:hypothetical protein
MATAVWFERVDVVSLKRKLVLQIFGSSTNLPMIPSSPTASLSPFPAGVEDATADMALTASMYQVSIVLTKVSFSLVEVRQPHVISI